MSFQLRRFRLKCLRRKNVLAAVIMLFNDEILDEDEMFCVFSELNKKNPPFSYWNYDRIEKQMDDMSSAEIKSEFRFGHSELPLLAEAPQIPRYFVCSNGTVASGMVGLLMQFQKQTFLTQCFECGENSISNSFWMGDS